MNENIVNRDFKSPVLTGNASISIKEDYGLVSILLMLMLMFISL